MFVREKKRIRLVLSVLVIHNSNTLYYCLILLWAAAVAAIKDLLLHKFRFFSFSLAFLRFSESVFNQTNGCWIFQFCQKYNQFIYLLLCIFFIFISNIFLIFCIFWHLNIVMITHSIPSSTALSLLNILPEYLNIFPTTRSGSIRPIIWNFHPWFWEGLKMLKTFTDFLCFVKFFARKLNKDFLKTGQSFLFFSLIEFCLFSTTASLKCPPLMFNTSAILILVISNICIE